MVKFLEIFESINDYNEQDKVPILYSLGISTGLIEIGNNSEDIKE